MVTNGDAGLSHRKLGESDSKSRGVTDAYKFICISTQRVAEAILAPRPSGFLSDNLIEDGGESGLDQHLSGVVLSVH